MEFLSVPDNMITNQVYIGSANNDWISLTQVKEVGIYLAGCPGIAKKVEVSFNNLWTLASLNSSDYTKTVVDQQWQVERKVPCWSHFIQPKERCRSPLPQLLMLQDILFCLTLTCLKFHFKLLGVTIQQTFLKSAISSLLPQRYNHELRKRELNT